MKKLRVKTKQQADEELRLQIFETMHWRMTMKRTFEIDGFDLKDVFAREAIIDEVFKDEQFKNVDAGIFELAAMDFRELLRFRLHPEEFITEFSTLNQLLRDIHCTVWYVDKNKYSYRIKVVTHTAEQFMFIANKVKGNRCVIGCEQRECTDRHGAYTALILHTTVPPTKIRL